MTLNKDKPFYQNKEWLLHQYIRLNKTTTQIADDLGVDVGTIGYWKRKFDLVKPRWRGHFDKYESWKLSIGCAFCGYNKNAYVLRFHHEKSNYKMNPRTYQTKMAKKELESGNLILLCSNCHLELHNKQGERKLD